MQSKIHPIILCGGSGTRLWPLSRQSFPKQFAPLLGQETLFQKSVKRLTGEAYASPLIITGDPFRFIVTEQLSAIDQKAEAILIEPTARNTAPAILAGALAVAAHDPDGLLLVAPSDHVIPDAHAFRRAVQDASPAAKAGRIITFGITPTRPETGFGWLELSAATDAASNDLRPLARFVEKPDLATAEDMMASGRFLWNAGIFLFTVKTLIAAFQKHQPATLAAVEGALKNARSDIGFTRLEATSWDQAANISIDYAIMEKVDNLSVMPFSAGWSDLGGWEAIWQESAPDANGNVGTPNATAIDCTDTLLRSESPGLEIVGIGLKDIVAVATADAVLVAHKSESQRVREAVDALKAKGAPQATTFPTEHRPWGWFESLASGPRFQVKRIVVQPGGSLSLQSHHHRAEHWIVVEGTARVTINDEVKLISENQSVYIPLGAIHRLENPGKVPMILIEVQTGSYLKEDDIVRYQDAYDRN